MYSIQGLWSAAELALPVTFVIVNNGGYRALDEFAAHFGLAAVPGTQLAHLDFCALARAQGVEAVRISSCAELDTALPVAFAAPGPVLLEVCVAKS
jgi:benzoylformate decarboxylase